MGSYFTWQSIAASLALFKRGYMWRVGTGERINIWLDPWIPSSPNKMVITPRGASVYTNVSELIDLVTKQLDIRLIGSLLSLVDVSQILQILLHNRGLDDFVAWSLTIHGKYLVMKRYQAQWSHQFGASAGQLALPDSSAYNSVWKILWKLKI
jgi:hypothetical protein